MSAHTPTPWVVGGQNGHCGLSILSEEPSIRVATVYLNVVSSEWSIGPETVNRPENRESVANAEFIVRACNSHEELLEACRAALPFARQYGSNGFVAAMIEAAIAKAEATK